MCEKLKSIFLPDTLTMLNSWAFPSDLEDIYYSGSKEAWKNIVYIDGNDDETVLEMPDDWNIHYNYVLPLEIVDAIVEKTETESQYVFEIESEVKYKNCSAYAVLYNEDHTLNGIVKVPLETDGSTTISVDKNDDAKSAVVFVWSKFFQPIIKCKDFTFSND